MVAPALPLAKLGGLLVKTLAKPMSKRIKHEFSRYEFSQNILVGVGQTTHYLTSRMTIWSAGYKVLSITPLERDVALSNGAEFIAESFVFLVAGGVLVYEYNKSKEKEKKLEQARHQQIVDESEKIQVKLNALNDRLVALEEVVKFNSDRILYLGKKYVEPVKAKEVPIDGTSHTNDDSKSTTNSDDIKSLNLQDDEECVLEAKSCAAIISIHDKGKGNEVNNRPWTSWWKPFS